MPLSIGPLNQKVERRPARSPAAGFQRAGQAAWRTRCGDPAMARGDACRFARPARVVVPASSAVRNRHRAYGCPEPSQRRRACFHFQRHPRVRQIASGHVHRATLTMFAGIPARFARRQTTRSIWISVTCARRRSRSNRRRSISTSGFPARASATSSPTRCRSAISTARIRSLGRMGNCCESTLGISEA